jgi:hypothetical protein
MKRILALAIAATTLYACGENQSNDAAMDDREDAPISSPATTNSAYTPSEGDVIHEGDDIKVYRNGQWVESDDEITLDNGAIVYEDGRVVKDDKEVELEDGEIATKTGNFFDRTGKAIEKGWEDVKQGAKKAGKDIEKGAEKAGDKVEGAVDNDNDGK